MQSPIAGSSASPSRGCPNAPASDHEITLCLLASSGFGCGCLCPAAQVLSVRLETAMPWKRCPPPVSLSSRGAVHARRVVVHAQSCAWRLSQGLGALRCSTSAAAGRFRDAFFGAIAARRRQWEGKAQSLARLLCRGVRCVRQHQAKYHRAKHLRRLRA